MILQQIPGSITFFLSVVFFCKHFCCVVSLTYGNCLYFRESNQVKTVFVLPQQSFPNSTFFPSPARNASWIFCSAALICLFTLTPGPDCSNYYGLKIYFFILGMTSVPCSDSGFFPPNFMNFLKLLHPD